MLRASRLLRKRQPPPPSVGLDLNEQGLYCVILRRDALGARLIESRLFEPLMPGCVVGGQLLDFAELEAALARLGHRIEGELALSRATDPDWAGEETSLRRTRGKPAMPRLAMAVPSASVARRRASFPRRLSALALEEPALVLMSEHINKPPSALCVDFVALGQTGAIVDWDVAAVALETVEDRVALLEAVGLPLQLVLLADSGDALALGRQAGSALVDEAASASESVFAVAYGLACLAVPDERASSGAAPLKVLGSLSSPTRSFNFLPYREAALAQKQKSFLLQLAAIPLLAMLTAAVLRLDLLAQERTQRAGHADLKQQLARLDAEARLRGTSLVEAQSAQDKVAKLAAFKQAGQHAPRMLHELASLVPDGLHLTRLALGAQGYEISGQARSAAEVFTLMRRLASDSAHFKQVALQDLSWVPDKENKASAGPGTHPDVGNSNGSDASASKILNVALKDPSTTLKAAEAHSAAFWVAFTLKAQPS